MNNPSVAKLYTYPIKSCAATELSAGLVTPTGLQHDRQFMLVDDTDNYVSQRQVPEMALIAPKIGANTLTLCAPGIEDLSIPLEHDSNPNKLIQGIVHGKPAWGQRVGSDADEWFSEVLPAYKNSGYRLLNTSSDQPRYIDTNYYHGQASNRVGFADGYPFLLTSESSLAALSRVTDEPVPMDRFRPNIVVAGDDLSAYDEDNWKQINVGNLSAFVVKACDRCAIPDVDQSTAETGKNVRKALAKSRRGVNRYDTTNKGVFFGQNLNHVYKPGTVIRVGDTVSVTQRDALPNVVLKQR